MLKPPLMQALILIALSAPPSWAQAPPLADEGRLTAKQLADDCRRLYRDQTYCQAYVSNAADMSRSSPRLVGSICLPARIGSDELRRSFLTAYTRHQGRRSELAIDALVRIYAARYPCQVERQQCRDRNFIWAQGPGGKRHIVGEALTDGAEYVWLDGRCQVVGGLIPGPSKGR